ncbi:MAG: hypothetical protein ACF8MF_00750 [Phycisphaerales bacterium JB052]
MNDETHELDTSTFLGHPASPSDDTAESLFEHYERRSLKTIIRQQQIYRESQAAIAAKVILDGAVIPEIEDLEDQVVDYPDYNDESDRQPRFHRIRVQRTHNVGRLTSPGAQIIYVLLTIAALGGTLGLAYSSDSPQLLLLAGIATPMLLPICVWRWFCWLDSAPYYYRLLTTLGEDARNLLEYRLLWKKSSRG